MNCFCQPQSKNPFNTIPSSLAGQTCQSDTCYNQPFFASQHQPVKETSTPRIYPLNKMGLRLDATAIPVKTHMNNCKQGWIHQNPITFDSPRGIQTVFNAPPLVGSVNVGNVCHDEIYTPEFSKYGKGYRNYMDISSGQIIYYMDDATRHPYINPVFSTPAYVNSTLFVDPMGQVKPQYDRVPAVDYSWNKPYTDACDSFSHDQLEFRQDIISRQQRKNNQQRFEYRFGDTIIAQSGMVGNQ